MQLYENSIQLAPDMKRQRPFPQVPASKYLSRQPVPYPPSTDPTASGSVVMVLNLGSSASTWHEARWVHGFWIDIFVFRMTRTNMKWSCWNLVRMLHWMYIVLMANIENSVCVMRMRMRIRKQNRMRMILRTTHTKIFAYAYGLRMRIVEKQNP